MRNAQRARKCRKNCKKCRTKCSDGFYDCIKALLNKCVTSQEQFDQKIYREQEDIEKQAEQIEYEIPVKLKNQCLGRVRRYNPINVDLTHKLGIFRYIADACISLKANQNREKCSCKKNFSPIIFRTIDFFIMSFITILPSTYSFQYIIYYRNPFQRDDDVQQLLATRFKLLAYLVCIFLSIFASILAFRFKQSALKGQIQNLRSQVEKYKDKQVNQNQQDIRRIKQPKCKNFCLKIGATLLTLIITLLIPFIFKYLLRGFFDVNDKNCQNNDICFGQINLKEAFTMLISFFCLIIFYPISAIVYPGIIYSKTAKKESGQELNYNPTHMLIINAYKVMVGAFNPILSLNKSFFEKIIFLNINSIGLFIIIWVCIFKAPCLATNSRDPHLFGFVFLFLVSDLIIQCYSQLSFVATLIMCHCQLQLDTSYRGFILTLIGAFLMFAISIHLAVIYRSQQDRIDQALKARIQRNRKITFHRKRKQSKIDQIESGRF